MNTLLIICEAQKCCRAEIWADNFLYMVICICIAIIIIFVLDLVYKIICKCCDSKKKTNKEIEDLKKQLDDAQKNRRKEDFGLKKDEFYEIELARKFADKICKGDNSNLNEEIDKIKKEIEELKKVKEKTIEIFVNKPEDKSKDKQEDKQK